MNKLSPRHYKLIFRPESGDLDRCSDNLDTEILQCSPPVVFRHHDRLHLIPFPGRRCAAAAAGKTGVIASGEIPSCVELLGMSLGPH